MPMQDTRVSLLARLRTGNEHADWDSFYDTYSGVILHYAMKQGLSKTDAEDVLQETMIDLMTRLKNFEYNPTSGKFRNFVFTLVHRQCLKISRRHHNLKNRNLDTQTDLNDSAILVLPDQQIEQEDELQWQRSLLNHCLQILRNEQGAEPETIDIFVAYAIEGASAQSVAERFNTNYNRVVKIKSRTLQRLKREYDLLNDSEEEDH